MKKSEQENINNIVLQVVDDYNKSDEFIMHWKRLRSCSAYVGETRNFYVLQSYNTIIALIDKTTDTLYDFLRYVYGYTSTSAQHISKFEHDYCQGKWSCAHRFTYRDC